MRCLRGGLVLLAVLMLAAPVARATDDPQLISSSNSMDFGNVEQGTTSDPQDLQLGNGGGGTLTITQIELNAESEYEITSDDCTNQPLGGGDSCIVTIVYHACCGSISGSVTIVSNDANSPAVVNLSGTGAHDETPPRSQFATQPNSMVVAGISTISGLVTDEFGVKSEDVHFGFSTAPGGDFIPSRIIESALTCTSDHRACAWSLVVPPDLVPGNYFVLAHGMDKSGNGETSPPIITVTVI